MKLFFWRHLTSLRDALPEWMCPPIDWLRYEVFYPYEYDY